MTLLLLLAVFTAFAVAVEALNFVAPDFLGGLHREAALKESIARTQAEVAESEKRLHALRTNLRNVHLDLNRAATGIEKLDEQFSERSRVAPVLIYPIATSNKASHVFRATITKSLPSDPEESQTLMWAASAFVEVEANNAADARAIALRQFPSQHGYALGNFEVVRAVTAEAAA